MFHFHFIYGHSIMSSRGMIMGPFLYIFYSCTQENGHSVSITFDKKNTTFVMIFCNAKTWLFNTTLKCLRICSVYYAVQFAVWTWVLARMPLLAQIIDWFEHVVNNLEWTCSINRNHWFLFTQSRHSHRLSFLMRRSFCGVTTLSADFDFYLLTAHTCSKYFMLKRHENIEDLRLIFSVCKSFQYSLFPNPTPHNQPFVPYVS